MQILPFLLLGLGVDDTFVIMGAYHGVDRGLSVDEKIAQTLERAGSSIFITSATDFCAFIMGRYTRLPAVQAFATYAAMGVLFDFIYQVGFFDCYFVIDFEGKLLHRVPSFGSEKRDSLYERRSLSWCPMWMQQKRI